MQRGLQKWPLPQVIAGDRQGPLFLVSWAGEGSVGCHQKSSGECGGSHLLWPQHEWASSPHGSCIRNVWGCGCVPAESCSSRHGADIACHCAHSCPSALCHCLEVTPPPTKTVAMLLSFLFLSWNRLLKDTIYSDYGSPLPTLPRPSPPPLPLKFKLFFRSH